MTDDAGGRFELDEVTGIISIKNASLLSTPGSHTVKVAASDGTELSAEQTFTISVTNAPLPPVPGQAANLGVGTKTATNTFTKADQSQPSVAVLEGGGHVVTWTSGGQDGSVRASMASCST